jgi:phosphatidyl-myo-inositol dimannoside synthase
VTAEEEPATETSTPRTLFITNDFPPRIGGAQSYYWGVIQTMDPADVVILAPRHEQASVFDATHPYTVVRASTSILWPTQALFEQALALCAEHDVQLVQLGHPLPAGLLGPRLRDHTGLPYVVFLGGAEVTLPAAVPGVSKALRHVLANAAMLITVSEYTAAAAGPLARGVPARVLRPPLDVDGFAPPVPEERAAAREALGVEGELVLCVGRLVPRKGQDMLVKALGRLAPEYPHLQLALVGEGRLATRLFQQAQRHGLADRVRLTGAVDDAGLHRWLRAADVFASPCRTRWHGYEVEGFGIVFAEAALCGLPVIAGRSGGAPESVCDGETGYVVDGRDLYDVAAALGRLLEQPAEGREAMGLRGRERAVERHAPSVVETRYRELLQEAATL